MQLVADFADMDEGLVVPDFHALYAAGFRVTIFRRSECYYDTAHAAFRLAADKTFERCAAAARAAGLVVGAYMFPDFTLGAPSSTEQVANFASAGDGVTGGALVAGVDLPPFLDIEFPGKGVVETKRTQAELAALIVEFGHALVAKYGCWGVYTSHVQTSDDNGLGGALGKLSDEDQAFLADALLWQKIPYRLGAGHPFDQVAPRDPHEGTVAWDPCDYYRVPQPWAWRGGWWLRQWQGDCRDLPGNLHQADVGDFRVAKLGDAGSHVLWLRRHLKAASLDDPGFDATLELAVRGLQTVRDLIVDGVAGPRVIAAASWM